MSVFSSIFTFLLQFNNTPTNFQIGCGHDGIDSLSDWLSSRFLDTNNDAQDDGTKVGYFSEFELFLRKAV